jgi:hypothetical protein
MRRDMDTKITLLIRFSYKIGIDYHPILRIGPEKLVHHKNVVIKILLGAIKKSSENFFETLEKKSESSEIFFETLENFFLRPTEFLLRTIRRAVAWLMARVEKQERIEYLKKTKKLCHQKMWVIVLRYSPIFH